MVNLGLLGAVSVGKTTLLRLFVSYINKQKLENLDNGRKCVIVKTDFSGEATLPRETTEIKETKTIHPNRVIFRDETENKAHTIFAPGGDKARAVVRMGIITISRIASQVIVVFSFDRSIDEQFEFFNDVRFFPKNIYVCLNKCDLIKGNKAQIDKKLQEAKGKIQSFFEKRKIKISDFFNTVGEYIEGMENYNDNAAAMILRIITEH
jgi:GTPase SAR1 family protein